MSSLPTFQISPGNVPFFEKFYDELLILLTSQILGRMCNTDVSVKCMMGNVCHSPTLCCYLETIIDFKLQKQGLLSSFRPLTGWGLH
jgi:hypothetical protein